MKKVGNWEVGFLDNSRPVRKVGNWEIPTFGNSRKSLQEPAESNGKSTFSGAPEKIRGKFRKSHFCQGKIDSYQGKIDFAQRNPEKVNQSFQNWLFISRRAIPTKKSGIGIGKSQLRQVGKWDLPPRETTLAFTHKHHVAVFKLLFLNGVFKWL